MAILEVEHQRIVARIVYDGPGRAGKTTNAEALCRQFSPRRRSELFIPDAIGGRTLFFDWLYVDAGMLEGYPLRLQIVTVPGQIILDHRRAHILRSADAVVFVCDSTRSRLQLVREKLDSLREHLSGREVPILIQANKQDCEDALGVEELRQTLALHPQTPIIRACASLGQGVLETLRAATQATAKYVSATIADKGIESFAGSPGSGTALHDEMVTLEATDSTASQETGGAPTQPDDNASLAAENTPSQKTGSAPTSQPDEASQPPLIDCTPTSQSTENAPQATGKTSGNAPQNANNTPLSHSRVSPPPPSRPTKQTVSEATQAPIDGPRETDAPVSRPPLPSSTLPDSQLWPVPEARSVLNQLDKLDKQELAQVSAQLEDGDRPVTGPWQVRTDAWTLHTSLTQRFDDLTGAHESMAHRVQMNTELGSLLPKASILAIQEEPGKGAWIWSAKPTLPTLAHYIQHAKDHTDRPAVTHALRHYASAVMTVVRLILRHRYPLRVTPDAFGVQDGRIVYIEHFDGRVGEPTELLNLASLLLGEVELHRNWAAAVSAYVNTLDHAIRKQLHADEVRQLDLVHQFSSTQARSTTADIARRRLLRAARSCGSTTRPSPPMQRLGGPR